MSVRVYLPCSEQGLRDLLEAGSLGPGPLPAHAVTDALRSTWPEGDEEEWEYAALTAAAQDSLALIGPDDPPRRVVVVAEVGRVTATTEQGPAAVVVEEPVVLRRVAAVHLDSAEAAEDVTAARHAWRRAEEGDAQAEATVARCLDHELGWFATQELWDIVGA